MDIMSSLPTAPSSLNALVARHPKLFAHSSLQWSDLPLGWLKLVDTLCSDIETVLPASYLPHFYVTQIKEKYGALRFYYQGASTALVEALIEFAEEKSETTCMVCGGLVPFHKDKKSMFPRCAECSSNQ
jgi:hypothetical protein